MKILPTTEICRNEINNAINFCKDFLGEYANYNIDVLKELKSKYQDIVDFIKDSDNTMVKQKVTTCGGRRNEDCLAVIETKLYKQAINAVNAISKIIELMDVNELTEIKGFNFTNIQVGIGSQYFYKKYTTK